MIVEMKKIHVVVQKDDIVSALESLRDIGVVHVEHQESLDGYQLVERQEEVKILNEAIAILQSVKQDEVPKQEVVSDWTETVNIILKRAADIDRLRDDIAKRQVLITQWTPWGNFNPENFDELRANGMFVYLLQQVTAKPVEIKNAVVTKVFSSGGMDRYVVVSREELNLSGDVIEQPIHGLNEMMSLEQANIKQIAELEEQIKNSTRYIDSLVKTLDERKNVLAFEEVEKGMREDELIAILKGFCPKKMCARMEKAAKEEGWALCIEDVSEEDAVPTLLDNPKWVQLSKPALDVIEILPGYREVDVSWVFLVFFTLFFGMLIGDAAYGFIFLAMVFVAQKTLGKKIKDHTGFHLGYLLTGFTCLWGVLTGTYFGQEWLSSSVKALVPWLNNSSNVQWLCFTIALIHLNIARLWTIKRKFPNLSALSEVGWLLIVWGMYFLANLFVLDKAFPSYAGWFFIVGISLALVFMFPFKDFFKKVPQELIPFVLNVIGAGTDIISYIRLFAVGLATVAVADAANFMPEALGWFVGGFFLILLHVINMILAMMAILVHAVRLNVLEFSGHLGLEWAGIKYNPFHKSLKQA